MARCKREILELFSGKIGDVVICQGKYGVYVRRLPQAPLLPATTAQRTQRRRFAACVLFYRSLKAAGLVEDDVPPGQAGAAEWLHPAEPDAFYCRGRGRGFRRAVPDGGRAGFPGRLPGGGTARGVPGGGVGAGGVSVAGGGGRQAAGGGDDGQGELRASPGGHGRRAPGRLPRHHPLPARRGGRGTPLPVFRGGGRRGFFDKQTH